jgi:hypothetical protein
LFSLRLLWERATLEEERERREVYGAAVSEERTALERKREAVSFLERALEGKRAVRGFTSDLAHPWVRGRQAPVADASRHSSAMGCRSTFEGDEASSRVCRVASRSR